MRRTAHWAQAGAPAACGLLVVVVLLLLPPAAAVPTWWRPKRWNSDGTLLRFQYQLSADTAADIQYIPGVQVYAIDMDLAAEAIPALKAKDPGIRVVCYFSAGSWEEFRVDDDQAKRSIALTAWGTSLGADMAGWPGERWVDVRRQEVRSIMKKRLDYCQAVKCDGVDPDNVNGHQNPTGFPLTKPDLLAFNLFLVGEAHKRGLAIGLKNGLDMIPQVAPFYDFAINEECVAFGECGAYQGVFIGKPVFVIEYCNGADLGAPTQNPACFCPRLRGQGLNGIVKHSDLTAAGISCTEYCKRNKCGSWLGTGSCAAGRDDICTILPPTPLL